jgi:Flp pilus assembly protein TadB
MGSVVRRILFPHREGLEEQSLLKAQFSKRQLPAGNPLANALVVIVGALAIGASLILGVAALIVLGSVVLVFAALVGIRVWWFNRRLARQVKSASRDAGVQQTEIIEGEYRVISSVHTCDPRPRQ